MCQVHGCQIQVGKRLMSEKDNLQDQLDMDGNLIGFNAEEVLTMYCELSFRDCSYTLK